MGSKSLVKWAGVPVTTYNFARENQQISWNIGVKFFHIEEVGDPIFCRTLTFEGNLRCYIYPKVFLKTLGCEPVCLVLKGTNSKLFIQWSNTSTLFEAKKCQQQYEEII